MSQVFNIINKEQKRQNRTIQLIASENFVSENIKKAVGSCFTNKYAEGYPNKRYYGGCQYCDQLEEYCKKKWQEVFNTDYHVNVQPHSGSQANMAVYNALLEPGDTILAMKLEEGGHLSHGSSVNFSGKLYNVVFYGLHQKEYIDYYDIVDKIIKYRPKLILAGASAYSRLIHFQLIYDIIQTYRTKNYNPYFMVDMAHIAGIVAAGWHPSPFGYADVITTTTHKTLRGTRGGLIFCKKELAKKIDSSVFPGIQGGPLMHVIAGKAVTAEQACTQEFKNYIKQVVRNSEAMAQEFKNKGYKIVSNGTSNHLFLLDLTSKFPNLSGKDAQEELDKHGITVNKNMIPGDMRKPSQTSGIRIGTAAMTTKGWTEKDFIDTAKIIDIFLTLLNEYHH